MMLEEKRARTVFDGRKLVTVVAISVKAPKNRFTNSSRVSIDFFLPSRLQVDAVCCSAVNDYVLLHVHAASEKELQQLSRVWLFMSMEL